MAHVARPLPLVARPPLRLPAITSLPPRVPEAQGLRLEALLCRYGRGHPSWALGQGAGALAVLVARHPDCPRAGPAQPRTGLP